MIGKSYIDSLDIYATYGIFITDGGYNGLAAFPALKKPEANDWQEENGLEVDLTSPTLNTREIQIPFAGHRSPSIKAFMDKLTTGAFHEFDLREAGAVFTLRLISQSERRTAQGLEFFTLTFADDQPLKNYTYAAPVAIPISQSGYTLDGRQLSDYGLWVLQGTEAEIRKAPTPKQNLLRNNASAQGAIYDGQTVTLQAREVTLKLSLIAPDLATFWHNHKSLLFDLTRPGSRSLHKGSTGETHACYYSHATVDRFSPTPGKIWCDFSITLVFTSTSNPI